MSKIRKSLIVGVVLIMCVGILCACNNGDDFRNPINGEPEAGEFYTLQEAFDNGWLSRGDLRNIAYHRTGDGQRKGFKPTPKNPEVLSAETELAIKEAHAANLRESGTLEAVTDGVTIIAYYGIYNEMIAVLIDAIYYAHPSVECFETVGNIKFEYDNPNFIRLWKLNGISYENMKIDYFLSNTTSDYYNKSKEKEDITIIIKSQKELNNFLKQNNCSLSKQYTNEFFSGNSLVLCFFTAPIYNEVQITLTKTGNVLKKKKKYLYADGVAEDALMYWTLIMEIEKEQLDNVNVIN